MKAQAKAEALPKNSLGGGHHSFVEVMGLDLALRPDLRSP